MKVSVLMPVYRTERRYLREAIRSILDQTFADFELLVLDDCPDDSREDVVREFDDPRIVYRKNDVNLGISPSRNRLLDMARGEYVAVFDHDDVSRVDRLEKQVAWLDGHPDCGVVSSWTREIPANRIRRNPEDDDSIRIGLMGGCVVSHSAAMIRASVLKECGIRYEERYSPAEDYMLWLRLLGKTQLHNIPEPLLAYRLYSGNTAKLQADRMRAATLRAYAFAQVTYPGLWAVHDQIARKVTVIRFLGLPIFRIETSGNRTKVRLFCAIPLIAIKRSRKVLWSSFSI